MKLSNTLLATAAAIASLGFTLSAKADTVNARCDYYPNGQRRATISKPCTFSQRQGYVSIEWSDGVRNEFTPVGSSPGNYVDQRGGRVYRQAGLGDKGQIFKMPSGSIYVYWNSAAANPQPVPTTQRGISTLQSSSSGSRINVRSQPTINANSPSYGLPGDRVKVIQCVQDRDTPGSDLNWCKVQFVQSKAIGWIRSDFIRFADGGE
jgi:hypothetical protein